MGLPSRDFIIANHPIRIRTEHTGSGIFGIFTTKYYMNEMNLLKCIKFEENSNEEKTK